jgi:hypothetical protein
MASVWYYTTFPASLTSDNGHFIGYFKTDNNLITEFYQLDNGFLFPVLLGGVTLNPSPNYAFDPNSNTKFHTNYGINITIKNSTLPAANSAYSFFTRVLFGIGIVRTTFQLRYLSSNNTLDIVDINSIIITPSAERNFPIFCFNHGSKILVLNKNFTDEYINIELLRKGDLVKTFKHGYRKIDLIGKNVMINNPHNFNQCMYKMAKTPSNGLIDDLIVTGYHSILVDDLGEHKELNDQRLGSQIIDGKHLLLASVSKDFIKINDEKPYTYYHFIVENNGDNNERFGVWANGVLTETPSKNTFLGKNFILLQD